eukprot:COSAG01_NODE_56653_length_317_cov_0.490826_2_plen_23_part_01
MAALHHHAGAHASLLCGARAKSF